MTQILVLYEFIYVLILKHLKLLYLHMKASR